jgi:hypothetical protein
MRPAFAAAQREWLISTDFDRTLQVLKANLADPTADAVCETLLIAHEVGGTDVDQRLRALIDDRTEDLQGRKDARAKQAGSPIRTLLRDHRAVRDGRGRARSIGDGRAAFQSAAGQLWVLVAFAMMAGCWMWARPAAQAPRGGAGLLPRHGAGAMTVTRSSCSPCCCGPGSRCCCPSCGGSRGGRSPSGSVRTCPAGWGSAHGSGCSPSSPSGRRSARWLVRSVPSSHGCSGSARTSIVASERGARRPRRHRVPGPSDRVGAGGLGTGGLAVDRHLTGRRSLCCSRSAGCCSRSWCSSSR